MKNKFADELSFLNDRSGLEIVKNQEIMVKTETPSYLNAHSETLEKEESNLDNLLEKINVLRLIIEKWDVVSEAGTVTEGKAVLDKENVLKSIIYNWKV